MRRTRRPIPDLYLYWKVTLFFLAAGIWLAGVISGSAWLTGAAIALLATAVLLRFLPGRRDDEPPS